MPLMQHCNVSSAGMVVLLVVCRYSHLLGAQLNVHGLHLGIAHVCSNTQNVKRLSHIVYNYVHSLGVMEPCGPCLLVRQFCLA